MKCTNRVTPRLQFAILANTFHCVNTKIHFMIEINELTGSRLPERLSQLHTPPKKLFIAGNLEHIDEEPAVAIVGSRKISPYGRQVTEKLAHELAAKGITIISGLALGVDSVAHRACLEAGGKTIAVLPTPLTKIHPASHRQLAQQIVDSGGALVSEYAENDIITRANFVARNRIVAALADAVVITEAALKSGSLHTAHYALNLGREVLAVPGNITSETSEGTNNLIKQGATPVTSAEDVLFALGLESVGAKAKKPTGSNEQEQIILDLITSQTTDGNELLIKSGLEASVFNQTLTTLEIGGKIRSAGGNKWTIL